MSGAFETKFSNKKCRDKPFKASTSFRMTLESALKGKHMLSRIKGDTMALFVPLTVGLIYRNKAWLEG